LVSLCNSVIAQDAVSRITRPVINHYARVTGINGPTVTLETDASLMFVPENLPDTVLLIQMTGIERRGNAPGNAGRYEFHIVTGVNGQNVTLKSGIAPFTFNPSTEIVQIVRVPSYKNAVIENTLYCAPWDWQTGTGGVLALMVDETLTLKADIDVTGLGFKGGKAYETPYPEDGPCSFSDDDGTDWPDYSDSYLYAGYKGEGAVTKTYFDDVTVTTKTYFDPNDPTSYWKGYGRTWNGGGGGNGKWSGGGGGANGGIGGIGEMQSCGENGSLPEPSGSVIHGNEGFAIKYNDVVWRDGGVFRRVFMGGGGGAGTGKGTDGGNGGGIVIIVAQNLHFEPNKAIKANGADAGALTTDAGAGGGGGGGSILLSAKDYGDIKVEIMGGNGGSVYREAICNDNSGNYTRGAGGGGGGGVLFTTGRLDDNWYNDDVLFQHTGGNEGDIISPDGKCYIISTPGDLGTYFDNFQVQLRGFLHNYIITPDTSVCNNVPVTIKASEPKGGTGIYNYVWQYSPDDKNWETIDKMNERDLIYPFTDDILYIRRIATSGDLTDFSSPILVNAYRVVNNDITPKDTTTCWKETLTIRENNPAEGGGGEPYTYHWQESVNNTWRDIDQTTGKNLTVTLVSGVEIEQSYRRQVTSGKGCISKWSEAVIHVQPTITGNTISPDEQRVCDNTAKRLTGTVLSGGTNEYDYQWQISSDSRANWENITNNADEPDFTPSIVFPKINDSELYQDYYYRRYITSGACESWSDPVMVRFDRQSSPSHITSSDKLGDNALRFQFTDNLYAAPPEIGVGTWTSQNNELRFDHPGEPVTTVNNLQIGVNTILWTVTNGVCVSGSDMVIIEVKDIIIPTGFSPGNDGFNDCFRIVGAENATSSELIILDRYNNVVFESNSFKGSADINNCQGWWDGRNMSGNELPSGTYSYQFTLNGNKIYKGYVVLKK